MRFHRKHLGERFSEAARLFWTALEREGMSLADATARLGVSSGTVYSWLYGVKVPEIQSAQRVAAEWPEIRTDLWTAPPSKPFTPPAARAEAS
jgi:transcriptional regulator with XRE-family HTH domain